MKKPKTAAVITFNSPGSWTLAGRKRIAAWLVQQAKDLVDYGKEYGKTLRARYIYVPK